MRFRTRARVRSPMSRPPRNTFDTVTVDTPRSAAMSFSRTAMLLLLPKGSFVFWRTGARFAHPTSQKRDAPNFLFAALERTACAPFIKERRMKYREPTKPHRKFGGVGHP